MHVYIVTLSSTVTTGIIMIYDTIYHVCLHFFRVLMNTVGSVNNLVYVEVYC